MEDGDEFTYSGAMEFYYNGLDGKFESSVLKNKFEEFSSDLFCLDSDLKSIVCKGNELTISVLSRVDGNAPALGFDTLKIYGIMKDDNHDGLGHHSLGLPESHSLGSVINFFKIHQSKFSVFSPSQN